MSKNICLFTIFHCVVFILIVSTVHAHIAVFYTNNLSQRVVDKFTKINETGFSVKWLFTADFLQCFPENVKICLLGGRLGSHH